MVTFIQKLSPWSDLCAPVDMGIGNDNTHTNTHAHIHMPNGESACVECVCVYMGQTAPSVDARTELCAVIVFSVHCREKKAGFPKRFYWEISYACWCRKMAQAAEVEDTLHTQRLSNPGGVG